MHQPPFELVDLLGRHAGPVAAQGRCRLVEDDVRSLAAAGVSGEWPLTQAAFPGPGASLREDWALERLPALHLILTQTELPPVRRRRTRHGVDVRAALSPQDAARFFRKNEIVLIYDHVAGTLHVGKAGTTESVIRKAS